MAVPFLSPLDMRSQKIVNLLDPTSIQDAVSKNYADRAVDIGGYGAVTNAKFVALRLNGTAGTGNLDFLDSSTGAAYVVPVGKIAILLQAVGFNNNASTNSVFLEAKIGGSYFRVGNTQTIATVTTTSLANLTGTPFLAGDGVAINTSVATLNCWAQILEFDVGGMIKVIRNTALTSGDQTLYTCPGGKTAAILSLANLGMFATGQIMIINGTAGSLNYKLNIVPSGGTVGTTNLMQTTVAIGTLSRTSCNATANLAPGDFISVNSSGAGAGQFCYGLVAER